MKSTNAIKLIDNQPLPYNICINININSYRLQSAVQQPKPKEQSKREKHCYIVIICLMNIAREREMHTCYTYFVSHTHVIQVREILKYLFSAQWHKQVFCTINTLDTLYCLHSAQADNITRCACWCWCWVQFMTQVIG